MIFFAELEPIQVDIGSEARHPGDDARAQLSEQDCPGQILLDLLKPYTAFTVKRVCVGKVVVVEQLPLKLGPCGGQTGDAGDLHAPPQGG